MEEITKELSNLNQKQIDALMTRWFKNYNERFTPSVSVKGRLNS